MNSSAENMNETLVETAFSKQSSVFDHENSNNAVIEYKRKRVRDHVNAIIRPGASILELNCGTGEDAIYFARRGHKVLATDISGGMLDKAAVKINHAGLGNRIELQRCSYHQLDQLEGRKFGHIFSNFGGLNCTGELGNVLEQFSSVLQSRGTITLVIIPPFCLWEFLFFFKGEFKTSLRRLLPPGGNNAIIEGQSFKCWYYRPSYIRNFLKAGFDLIKLEGLCTIVPPSYKNKFLEAHPRVFDFLMRHEIKRAGSWPWKYCGDYFMISFRKRY